MSKEIKREPPYSLRLSAEQRAILRDRAGRASLGTYIKSVLFSEEMPKTPRRRSSAVKDEKALADVLACLGASRIAGNLNQLAKATHIGNFYFDEETKRVLIATCNDVKVMRQMLMLALGYKPGQEPKAPESTSQTFTRAATNSQTKPRFGL